MLVIYHKVKDIHIRSMIMNLSIGEVVLLRYIISYTVPIIPILNRCPVTVYIRISLVDF